MRNISEIDVTKYVSYIYTDLVGDFKVQVLKPTGYADVAEGIDFFSLDSGSVVAIEKDAFFGFHDAIIVQGDVVKHIELTPYESFVDIFTESQKAGYTYYVFTTSEIVTSPYSFIPGTTYRGYEANGPAFRRCDVGNYGTTAIERNQRPFDYMRVFSALNHTGLYHINRCETSNSHNINDDQHIVYNMATTLSGLIKLIHEWSLMAEEPFNSTEDCAIVAKNIMDNIDIPSNVLQDILDFQNPSHLSKYIMTGEHQIEYPEEKREFVESFKNYILNKCKYNSLNTLAKIHPSNPQIPESILLEEKSKCQESVYRFCVLNDISIEDIDLYDILDNPRKYSYYDREYYPVEIVIAVERLLNI